MNDITERQAQVLKFIEQFVAARGYPPTRTEIAKRFGFRSANASQDHITALERKGYLQVAPGLSRGLRVLKRVSG